MVAQGDGRARFKSAQIAHIMVRLALAKVGVPLVDSDGHALLAALGVQAFAEAQPGAVSVAEGLPDEAAEQANEVLLHAESFRFLLVFHDPPPLDVFERLGLPDVPQKFYDNIFPVTTAETQQDIDRIVGFVRHTGGASSWSVIDLMVIGQKLVQNAGGPIAEVLPGPAPLAIAEEAAQDDELWAKLLIEGGM